MIVLINEHQGFLYICVCVLISYSMWRHYFLCRPWIFRFSLLLNYSKSCVKHSILQGNARRLLDKHLMRIATKIFKIRTCLDTLVFNIYWWLILNLSSIISFRWWFRMILLFGAHILWLFLLCLCMLLWVFLWLFIWN